ncbi:hypothetical protein ABZV67_39650 [Streptomyces sp. NPDC005065]|uniref:hypothetical protein n=1 Tax=Streptomyces sp. NPDC005065 TaxID=3154461 RepID=UPI0033BBA01D
MTDTNKPTKVPLRRHRGSAAWPFSGIGVIATDAPRTDVVFPNPGRRIIRHHPRPDAPERSVRTGPSSLERGKVA